MRGPLALALALSGCGDQLLDQGWLGAPLAHYEVRVANYLPSQPPLRRDRHRIAMFWSPLGPDVTHLDALVEDPRTGRSIEPMGPTPITVLDAPTAAHRVQGAAESYALGRLLVYLDEDGDGRRGEREPIVGGVTTRAFLYAPARLAPRVVPTATAVPAGLHAVMLPMACGDAPPAPTTTGCAVPLGEPCLSAATCGDGVCVRTLGPHWPDGACGVAEDGAGACRPADAAWLPFSHDATIIGHHMAACSEDADCARPGLEAEYICDRAAGACVPGGVMWSVVVEPFIVPPFCRRDWPADGHYQALPGRPAGPPMPRPGMP